MQTSSLQFRVATATDNILLADLGGQAFTQAFAKDNTPEDMAAYLPTAFSPDIQAAEFADPFTTFWIMEDAGNPIGYVKLVKGTTVACLSETITLKIARLYILSSYWGKGFGHKMLNQVIAYAQENKFKSIWLTVWEQNFGAIKLYREFGFVVVGQEDFILGFDVQNDFIMEKVLP